MTVRGLGFPFTKGSTELPEAKTDEDVIEDNIRRILLTRRRERVMRPDVGSNIYDFVFENVAPVMRAGVNHEVRRALETNEPRIQVVDVQVEQQPENVTTRAREVIVTVVYEINRQLRSTDVAVPA